jgi:formate transporter
MYFVPFGLLITTFDPGFAAEAGVAGRPLTTLTWAAFVRDNLLPVTIGNVLGGAGLVGLVYWFVYLRPGRASWHQDAVPPHGRGAKGIDA